MTVESLSMRWWGLDWRSHLPVALGGGVTVVLGTVAEAEAFVRAHYPGMFPAADGPTWLVEPLAAPMTEVRRRFYRDADIFLLHERDRAVGLEIGHPSDWSTYYLRTLALLPEHRGRHLTADLGAHLAKVLASAGVERIEADINPTNTASLIAHTRLGFVATGTLNSERWGLLVRVTRFLRDDADAVFRRQYCAVAWPRRPPGEAAEPGPAPPPISSRPRRSRRPRSPSSAG